MRTVHDLETLLLALFVLALLIRNAAACLASGLAGGLALTATAVYGTVTKIACFDSLDMQHNWILQSYSFFRSHYIRLQSFCQYCAEFFREERRRFTIYTPPITASRIA
jgi:hypothetical protein